jgi:hypothetical protein
MQNSENCHFCTTFIIREAARRIVARRLHVKTGKPIGVGRHNVRVIGNKLARRRAGAI